MVMRLGAWLCMHGYAVPPALMRWVCMRVCMRMQGLATVPEMGLCACCVCVVARGAKGSTVSRVVWVEPLAYELAPTERVVVGDCRGLSAWADWLCFEYGRTEFGLVLAVVASVPC